MNNSTGRRSGYESTVAEPPHPTANNMKKALVFALVAYLAVTVSSANEDDVSGSGSGDDDLDYSSSTSTSVIMSSTSEFQYTTVLVYIKLI